MEKYLKVIAISTSVIAGYFATKFVLNTLHDTVSEVKRIVLSAKSKEETGKNKEDSVMGFHI
jgi:hypothetical protein